MLYKYIEGPTLPAELKDMCLDFDNLEINPWWPTLKKSAPNNTDKTNTNYPQSDFAQYKQYLAPELLIIWLNDHGLLNENVRHPRIQRMVGGNQIYPHFDYPRTFAINYLITDSVATTCFYKHKTNPDIKPSATNESIASDEIELTDSVVFDHHRWHWLDVTKIHNVTNITIPRVAITLSGYGPA